MVPSWADRLLPQLLMEQFDTLPIQCRHIEHMHEGVWAELSIFVRGQRKVTGIRYIVETLFIILERYVKLYIFDRV